MFPVKLAVCSITVLLALALPLRAQVPSAVATVHSIARERWVAIPQREHGVKLQRRDKGMIRTVMIPDESMVRIRSLGSDPTLIRVVGLKPGLTTINLTDERGQDERVFLIVLPKTKWQLLWDQLSDWRGFVATWLGFVAGRRF